ncbi:hypothetical protein NDU88_004445 [Pleurodeles waltl]|uniref:Uncharacterized protein n=1 Tax=Pleurodeles waltl TaxID=8319 RepID=A0AAV7LQZ8_PLEWA|nr:hypothetical protein NDU88_004445 [Pleurodeles waltl]
MTLLSKALRDGERRARRGVIAALQQRFGNTSGPGPRAPGSATLRCQAKPVEPAGKIPEELDIATHWHIFARCEREYSRVQGAGAPTIAGRPDEAAGGPDNTAAESTGEARPQECHKPQEPGRNQEETRSAGRTRLITSFFHKVGQKVDMAFSLQQITEQITEHNNKQANKQIEIESELQLEKQDAALAQEPEQEPAQTALRTEDVGGESYGRCSERGSETRAA